MIKVNNLKNQLLVELPSSKSEINRLLILAAINPNVITLNNVNFCSDVLTMIETLEKLGIYFEISNKKVKVLNYLKQNQHKGKKFKISLGDGGTTIRFLLSLFAYVGGEYELDVDEEFKNRPNNELFNSLRQLGCSFEQTNFPLKMKGAITKKYCEVDCSKSSQFYSSLLLISSVLSLEIKALNLKKSINYVEQTKKLIEQVKNGVTDFDIPTDASSYSYALAYNELIAKVEIKNLIKDEVQADWKIIDILKTQGPLNVDMSQCLDLFPTLAFVASNRDGVSEFSSLSNLKYKESNRLEEVIKLLDHFEVKYQLVDEVLFINGNSNNQMSEVEYFAPKDHRMIMTAFLFMKKNNGGIIHNEKHVKKSYPHFFEDFKGE